MNRLDRKRIPLCDITCSARLVPVNSIPKFEDSTDSSESEEEDKMEKDSSESLEGSSKGKKNDDKDYDYQDKTESDSSEGYYKSKADVRKIKRYKMQKASQMSEYERMVQKNREEKIAFLESLKINELKEDFTEAVKARRARAKTLKEIKRSRPSTPPPRRKSLRLANVNIDLSEKAVVARAMSEIKTEEAESEVLPPVLPFKNALKGDESYENFVNDFDDLDHKVAKPFNDYESYFGNMQLPESQIAKVVYSRITSLAVHPMREKIIVAAGSKYGKIGFWDVNSDSNPYVFEPHLQGITNLKFNPYKTNIIVSSSYDGTLRCGDFEKKVFNEVYNVSEETSCTYFDFLSPTTFLVAQRNGNVSVVDNRSRSKTSEKRHKCHFNSVKTVSIHPLDKSYFISAENKGAVCLWDLRKLQREPVVEVRHHKRCVASAFFSPLTGKSVLTTSSDDTICLFDSSNLGKSLTFKKFLKHNNQTGRWLTPFKAMWIPNTDDTFIVGSMLYPRRIEVFNDEMENIFNFKHDNLSCITSTTIFHPSIPVVVGANSSGKVYVFTDTKRL